MTERGEQLLASALQLNDAERIEFAERLYSSVDDASELPLEKDPAFAAELQRRSEDFRTGRTKGIPADQVFKNLEEHLKQIQSQR